MGASGLGAAAQGCSLEMNVLAFLLNVPPGSEKYIPESPWLTLHVPEFGGRKEGAPGLVPDAGQARLLLCRAQHPMAWGGGPGAGSTAPSPVCAWAGGEAH